MSTHCCLNPHCRHPPQPRSNKFCNSCGQKILPLKHRYHPLKLLGQGGFGKAYLAEDLDKLQEKCVIKQLITSQIEPDTLVKVKQLFADEARRLQELGHHPQIPTLLAYFEEDNYFYLVQEAIDGEDLAKEINRDRIFTEAQIHLFLQDLLSILQVVHQHQIIHRDIKPENIIRRHSDRNLVLIDFGASKQLTTTAMSKAGTRIGSPGYTPLEQMMYGVTYRSSDLYAVGATCFHFLSGIHPADFWESDGYRWTENWRKHVRQSLSPNLIKILDKLLQPKYQDRYQTVAELSADLQPLGVNLSSLPTVKVVSNSSFPTLNFGSNPQNPSEIPPDDWFKVNRDRDSLWRRVTGFLFDEH
jgi:serine/threonine protein kinase